MNSGEEHFRTLIREAGHRATPGRIALLETLQKAGKPMSISEILDQMHGTVDETTIYRTLDALKEKKIVRQLDFQHGHGEYELVDAKHHHHLVCVQCNKVEDIVLETDLADEEKRIEREKKFKILDHSLEFFGLCEKCQLKQKS